MTAAAAAELTNVKQHDSRAVPGPKAEDEVVFDPNPEAQAHAYYDVGCTQMSPDGALLALTVDTRGDERYSLVVHRLGVGGQGAQQAELRGGLELPRHQEQEQQDKEEQVLGQEQQAPGHASCYEVVLPPGVVNGICPHVAWRGDSQGLVYMRADGTGTPCEVGGWWLAPLHDSHGSLDGVLPSHLLFLLQHPSFCPSSLPYHHHLSPTRNGTCSLWPLAGAVA